MKPEPLPKINLGHMRAYMPQGKPKALQIKPPEPLKQEDVEDRSRLWTQLLISGAICVAVLGMRKMDLPVTQKALSGIKMAVSSEEPYDNALGRLSFVTNLFPETTEVFHPMQNDIVLPIAGDVMSITAEETVFSAAQTQQVKAAAAGRVFYAGQDTVRLVHPSGYESVYRGIVPAVKAGQELNAGDSLGSIAQGERLTFTLLQDGKPISAEIFLK